MPLCGAVTEHLTETVCAPQSSHLPLSGLSVPAVEQSISEMQPGKETENAGWTQTSSSTENQQH